VGTKEHPLRRIPATSAFVRQHHLCSSPAAARTQVAQCTPTANTPTLKHHQIQQHSAPALVLCHSL